MEAGQVLLAGRADVALIAEPAAAGVLMRAEADGQTLHRGVQMREVLGQITGLRPSLPQASLAIRADYAAANPGLAEALVEALAEAATSLNADPSAAAEHASAFLDRSPRLLERAIPFAHIEVQSATDARPEIEALYSALLAADPGIVGGALPDDAFYGV
jgi:NitT/TauT family transport system substrate-binding protein